MSAKGDRRGLAAALKAVFLPQTGSLKGEALGLRAEVEQMKRDAEHVRQNSEMELALRRFAGAGE